MYAKFNALGFERQVFNKLRVRCDRWDTKRFPGGSLQT